MRDHDACEDAINAALARGDDGRAEFLAARCDLRHTPDHTPDPRATEARAALTEEEADD